jgi:hypothetical protein
MRKNPNASAAFAIVPTRAKASGVPRPGRTASEGRPYKGKNYLKIKRESTRGIFQTSAHVHGGADDLHAWTARREEISR